MLPYKRGLNKPFLKIGIFWFSTPLQKFKSVLSTFLDDFLSVFMKIHIFQCCYDTSYPEKFKCGMFFHRAGFVLFSFVIPAMSLRSSRNDGRMWKKRAIGHVSTKKTTKKRNS